MGTEHSRLSSRLGFIMLSAGCAVGLGNVWRFPFVVGRNGGAAFVAVYFACLALMGLPLMAAELAVGRAAKSGIATAFAALSPSRTARFWKVAGLVLFAGMFVLMAYYTDVTGWLLGYCGDYVAGSGPAADPARSFASLLADRPRRLALALLAIAGAAATCAAGLVKGVERITKIMMLAMLGLLVALAVRAASLPGAAAGLEFYLRPDWARFMEHPVRAVFDAMGQAFFTLSVGIGCMTQFGAYVSRERSLVGEAAWITAIDTVVAVLAGLVVFPMCSAFGVDAGAGPGLVFIALPKAFAAMAGGRFWGALFFLFLSFAALTTVIAVTECLIAGLAGTRLPRGVRAAVATLAMAAGVLPCVMFDGVMEAEDFAVSRLWLPIGGVCFSVFVASRLGWGAEAFIAEVSAGKGPRLPRAVFSVLKFAVPALVLLVLAAGLFEHFAG